MGYKNKTHKFINKKYMQFFFTRKYTDAASVEKTAKDSFNIDSVMFTTEQEDGTRVVILNNGHAESRYDNYPVVKNGKVIGQEFRKESAWYESQITLNKEDNNRFVNYFDTSHINSL